MRYIYIILIISMTICFGCKKDNHKNEIHPFVQDIKEWVFAPGQLEWDDTYNLTAQNEGILMEANFEIGTHVSPDEIMAIIQNPSSNVNLATAKDQYQITQENLGLDAPAFQQLKENIEFATKQVEQSKTQADRYSRLFENQSVSKLEYEHAKLELENAQSNLNALKKQYDIAKQQAKQQNITAAGQFKNSEIIQSTNKITGIKPGKIIKKLKGTGDFVRKGDVIAVVANPKKIKIMLSVDEKSVHRLSKGQEAKIQLNTFKEHILTGKVEEILEAFDDKIQSFICKVELTDSIPTTFNIYGTSLEGNILVGEKKQALLIPRNFMGYGNQVMIKGKDSATTIKVGIVSTDYVEVLEGLGADDILIPLRQ